MTTLAPATVALDEFRLLSSDGQRVGLREDDHGRPQPLSPWPARRGAVHAFIHGRVTNRADVCRDLGVSADGPSDHDLVLEAYLRWREAGLERFRGVFVAGVIDEARSLALVARDQIGCHPLFYAVVERGRQVVFATSARDLLDVPGVSRDLNRVALADHLCRRWPDLEETFFAHVKRVPPGCRLRVTPGVVAAERYWEPVPDDRPVDWVKGDIAGQFNEALDRAVDRCLVNGPSGIFLSGGFDSISVAAVATDRARAAGWPVPLAFSLEFPHPGCNERPTQVAIAQALGLPQTFVHFDDAVGAGRLLSDAMAFNAELGAPVLNAWFPAYASLARTARAAGAATLMTGNGGDEWLGVTPMLSADLIRGGRVGELVAFMRMWQRSYSPDRLPLLKNALWTYGLRPIGSMMLHRLAPDAWAKSRLGRAMRRDPTWVAPDPAVRAAQRERLPRDMQSPDPPLGFYIQDARSALDHALVSWELEEQYHMGRLAGVWFQHPYWDADLIDMLYRTPPDALNAGGRSKGLVRGTMATRFPSLGLERRRKVGAATFYKSLLATEGPVVVEAAGGFPALAALGVVEPEAARAGLETLFAGNQELYRAWELANLESWARQFVA